MRTWSVSSVKGFHTCQLQWYFRRQGLPEEFRALPLVTPWCPWLSTGNWAVAGSPSRSSPAEKVPSIWTTCWSTMKIRRTCATCSSTSSPSKRGPAPPARRSASAKSCAGWALPHPSSIGCWTRPTTPSRPTRCSGCSASSGAGSNPPSSASRRERGWDSDWARPVTPAAAYGVAPGTKRRASCRACCRSASIAPPGRCTWCSPARPSS